MIDGQYFKDSLFLRGKEITMVQTAIIGGGAAGFFAAIIAKETQPAARVVIFEKSDKVLSKVRVSGGGRCNLTNACDSLPDLCNAYPRGGKAMKKLFLRFSNKDTVKWFESRGVPLIIRDDLRVFPESGDAGTIVNCLVREAKNLGIEIYTSRSVKEIKKSGNDLRIIFEDEKIPLEICNKVIVTTGGSPGRSGLEWLEKLGHTIEEPVPSLFTFNMPGEKITALMGVSADKSIVKIQGTKLLAEGPLLITHWGMSGPSILKLSSFGARILHDLNYSFNIQVNWAGEINNDKVMVELVKLSGLNPRKMMVNLRPFHLPDRLWQFLLRKIDLPEDKTWGETGKKGLNRIVSILTNDVYKVDGRTTFKEEFVTCGGICLDCVDMNTMESKVCKNLYFAGEVLDIDAITGGFNLQAAWTTGWIAGNVEC